MQRGTGVAERERKSGEQKMKMGTRFGRKSCPSRYHHVDDGLYGANTAIEIPYCSSNRHVSIVSNLSQLAV